MVDERQAIDNLNSTQASIVAFMRDNPNVTMGQLAKKIGLSESGIKKNIRILKYLGIIERIGADKNGYWSVKERNK